MLSAAPVNRNNESAEKFPREQGRVVLYLNNELQKYSDHESVCHTEIAKKLATLKGYNFAGQYDPGMRYPTALYFVPATTLGSETAREIGIFSEKEFFGGVVPYPFVATKAITHPLVYSDAFAPPGWSHTFADQVKDVTLFGHAAFTLDDAHRAGMLVLGHGPARVKPARGVGGRGQEVVSTADELDAVLTKMDQTEVTNHGVVIEQNLDRVTTFSVGEVRVSDLIVTYYGKQRLTKDSRKSDVYGGSDLVVVRGDYDELLKIAPTADLRLAISQARTYDAAAEAFPGFMASRRNYDVAQGLNTDARFCSGVLEQSWRIGGASAAELVALEKFHADPTLRVVRASCVEAYGDHQVPANAVVQFCGVDDRVGPITKYTMVKSDAGPL
jgi:hypothetical protein